MTKLQEKEDRISALPDHLIQHILSFLPSTNASIRTTVLSKRWLNQWTHVPVLVFDNCSMSVEKFSRSIDYTLLVAYRCSKIKKFHIRQDKRCNAVDLTINWDVKFRFAITRDVEDLFIGLNFAKELRLPKFIFEHPSYVKLYLRDCDFSPIPNRRSVSWPNLKELKLVRVRRLPNNAIENILSGSPSLESFEFSPYYPTTRYDIVSKSLKKLKLIDYNWSSTLQISCPNLEELDLSGRFNDPATLQLMNSSSLIRAILDFEYKYYAEIKNIMQQFKHINELEFKSNFIKSLSVLKSSGSDLSSMLLNNKYLALTLDNRNYNLEEYHAGIECALHLSHMLEELVIMLVLPNDVSQSTTNHLDLNNISGENYWNSNTTVFNCSVSHLKIVEIDIDCDIDQYKFVLPFIEFILKNARVLEKLVVGLERGTGKDFAFQVSQKLLDLPRCSQHATVKLLLSN